MAGRKTVLVAGTMDTKGKEYVTVLNLLHRSGIQTIVMNLGLAESPAVQADILAEQVAAEQGASLQELREKMDRSLTFEVMGKGGAMLTRCLVADKAIDGAIFIGGGQGTLLSAMLLRELPIGMPKVLVSTLAGIRVPPFEGIKDTLMLNPMVDVEGNNSVLHRELENAANALIGMVNGLHQESVAPKCTIGVTMFGITTPCVSRVCHLLEEQGYQVLVFHANGTGGKTMEQMVREGLIQGIVDITLSEISNALFEGSSVAGPDRLEVAGALGIPQVVSLGALDAVNYMPPSSMPERYLGRKYLMHNPNLKVLRTGKEELELIAQTIARKLNAAKGPVTLAIPRGGLSANDQPGKDFFEPETDEILFRALKQQLDPNVVRIVESEHHINHDAFADLLAEEILLLLQEREP